MYEGSSPAYYPQPFLPGSDGSVRMAGISGGPVSVRVFSIEGRFLTEVTADSVQEWTWDGATESGSVSSGVYMTLVRVGDSSWTCRMAVVR